MKRLSKSHTIGFLTFDIAGTYNNTMWRHLFNVAKQRNINLITFCGGVLLDESPLHRQWNKVYDLASSQSVDGLIVLSASLSQTCGKEKLSEFLKRFAPLPIVSIGVALNEAVSILLDNEGGMRQVVCHLLDEHNVTEPVFLAGPQNNDEANLRLRVFREEMGKRGLIVRDNMIHHVAYRYDLAIEAVEKVIDAGIRFDSVIAVNDDTALGAFDALKRRGIKVPYEVAICGFDNTEQSLCNAVPLTTVQQPHSEMAVRALDAMCSILAGQDIEKRQLVPTRLVVRKSCGCLLKGYLSRKSLRENTARSAAGDDLYAEPENRDDLEHEFAESMNSGDFGPLLRIFDEELMHSGENNDDDDIFTGWHNYLTAWSYGVLDSPGYSDNQKRMAADFFDQAHFAVIEAEKNRQAGKRLEAQKKDYLFILFSSYFSPLIDMKNFLNHISRELPKFGVRSFFVSLFSDKKLTKAREVLYFLPNGETFWNIEGSEYESVQLLPDTLSLEEPLTMVVEPLLNYEEIIGYFIFHLAEPVEIIENVRQIITNSFLSILLAQEVIRDKQLKILLENLELKQQQLEEAYRSLKENQEKMLVIDKMASLGRMTAGIAHEMNTPIASIRTSISELTRLADEYRSSIGDPDVGDEDHREIAADMHHSLELAEKAAERAAAFVHGIKAQTRDLSPKDHFRFDAVKVVREALLLLGHALKQGNCEIELTCGRDYMELAGAPGRLAQVITNLVNNAIDACPKDGSGRILISIDEEYSEVILKVADNGSGIPGEIMTKIFDPMFTTKPFGVGTGLGLTLVHDIVTGDFGGSVEVKSEPDSGTEFIIHLKKSPEAEIGTKI